MTLTINTASAFTTNQKALIMNTHRDSVVQDIQEFVILNGYRLQYADPANGVFQVFVRETTNPGYLNANSNMFYFNPPSTTEWYFSLKVLPKNNDVMVIGTSSGGMFPGRYFKKYIQYMKTKGYNVLVGDKITKSNSSKISNTSTTQISSNIPTPAIIPPVRFGTNPQQAMPNNQFVPQYSYGQPQYQTPAPSGMPKNFSNNPTDPSYRIFYNF